MDEKSATITRSRAIELINASIDNFATFYDSYCHDNKGNLSQEEIELYEQMNEVMYILRTDKNYRNDLENMPREDLTEFLLSCKEMAENHDLTIKFSYPKGKILIVENESTNPELIEKTLEKLEVYGDLRIKNAIKEYHSGERAIRFSNMPKNQYGKTVCINDKYSHFVTERFKENTPENQVSLAVTLAHEFKRSATSDTLEGETRDLILEDTKIIESFADSYGEGIYKKFPEYGILHYIKKLFGETELKDFAGYAFDSSGSYWKVNDTGDLLDDGNVSQVKDINDNVIYSGSKGRQGTLQEWLGLANAFTALMQPAGYEWSGTEKKWTKNPGKITHSVIEQAYKEGKLTDDQYNLIECAAGLVAAKDEKNKNLSLFEQVMSDIQKTNQINTQIRVDMVNRTWEWIKKKWKIITPKSTKDDTASATTDSSFSKAISSKSVQDKIHEWNEIDRKNKIEFDKNEEKKYQEAKKSGKNYTKEEYEPISRCDEYSTEVLKSAGILPKDWPSPETTRVSAYWTKLASKLKDSPEEGWNVMLMRSVDSTGKEIGFAPHMAVIYVNTDGSISVAHYTKGKTRHSEGWSQIELEKKGKMVDGVWHAKFNYTSEKDGMKAFGYYSLGDLK